MAKKLCLVWNIEREETLIFIGDNNKSLEIEIWNDGFDYRAFLLLFSLFPLPSIPLDVFLFSRRPASGSMNSEINRNTGVPQTLYPIGKLKNRKRMIFTRLLPLFIRVLPPISSFDNVIFSRVSPLYGMGERKKRKTFLPAVRSFVSYLTANYKRSYEKFFIKISLNRPLSSIIPLPLPPR